MRWTLLLLTGLAFAASAPEPSKADRQKALIGEMVKAGVKAAGAPNVKQPFFSQTKDAGQILDWIAGTFGDQDRYRRLEQVLEARLDKQVGATPSASGTTSLAMKGAAPQILGFAVEHGALTEKVDGNTATFRGNPAGILAALRGGSLLDQYLPVERSAGYRFFQPLSWAATFDTSKAGVGTLLANQQQLTSWSLRYVFVNRRDAGLREYSDLWKALATAAKENATDAAIAEAAQAAAAKASPGKAKQEADRKAEFAKRGVDRYSQTRTDLFKGLEQWPVYSKWFDHLTERVIDEVDDRWAEDGDTVAAAHRFDSILTEELPEIDKFPAPPGQVAQAIDRYIRKLTDVATAAADIYAYANKGMLATADWTTKRDPNLPDLYTITAIFETSTGKARKQDLTINSAVSFYRVALKQNNQQFHDYTLAGQYDVPLGDVWKIPLVLSFAGKYEYIPNDTASSSGAPVSAMIAGISASSSSASTGANAITGGSAFAPKGNLGVLQVKLTIPVKGTGVKIPLSWSIANRTELIKEKEVRANFGITFDLDTAIAAVLGRGK